jgi:hypothetical protein
MFQFPKLRFLTMLTWVLMASANASAKPHSAVVGEATMVIGQARLFSPDGEAKSLARGAPVREGDRIETGAGGHVHLKFVDGGRLSVRPASRLQIENYSHKDQQSALTAIRFKLDEGTARSITGSWGEESRDRFRLNTPLAAIGVKGTDFSVSADASQTLASVYSGAIVVTPMGQSCSATLGPCVNGNERLLSETMKGQVLTLNQAQLAPQVVAFNEPASARTPTSTPTTAASVAPVATERMVATERLVSSEKQMLSEIRQIVLPESTPQALVPREPQLQWMRWPWTQVSSLDNLSKAFDAATLSAAELSTTDGAFALLRHNPENLTFSSKEGQVDFRLSGAVANLIHQDGPTEKVAPVTVNNGRLSVDFSRATYNTQLNVSSNRLGQQDLNANGIIQPSGAMLGAGGNMGTRGSLSTDGREAGYFFSGDLPEGQVRGITLWGR